MSDRLDETRGDSPPSRGNGEGSTWTLVAIGSGKLRTFAIPSDGEVTIGRDPDCAVMLDHHRVSRLHARVAIAGGSCVVTDLDSRNGTFVGGARIIEPRTLVAGEGFAIGPFTLIAAREATAKAAPATTGIDVADPTVATAMIESIAKSPTSLLIRGESGTGKQVLAETIHAASGRSGTLVAINCAAIAGELLESELFGHERGAFTGAIASKPGLFELAAGGTVLLDEIGDMSLALQAKLLRAVETREILRVGGTTPIGVDARFVSATHHDLLAAVEAGTFRLDLYYRLACITLVLAPLRARRDRIAGLARRFAGGVAVTAEAIARLNQHDYPGNVRELKNVIERASVLASGASIDAEHVVFDEPRAKAVSVPSLGVDEEAERARIIEAIAQCHGNQTRAAKLLGMARSTLTTKISILRIPRPRK